MDVSEQTQQAEPFLQPSPTVVEQAQTQGSDSTNAIATDTATETATETATATVLSPNPRSFRTRKAPGFWRAVFLDILLTLGAIPFLVLGIAALSANGKPTNEVGSTSTVLTASYYGGTFFPILFSAAVGRFMTKLASFRLERGTTVQTMEQLQGSQTVFSAFKTQYELRICNSRFILLASFLSLVWCLSPLGSQASLRVASLVETNRRSSYDMSYLDIRQYYSPGDSDYSTPLAGSMFLTAMMMPPASQRQPQDVWGNVRIPLIEQLETSPSLDWIPIDSDKAEYESLLGIPILLNVSTYMNLSFSLNTSYWWLNCRLQKGTDTDNLAATSPKALGIYNSTMGAQTRMGWELDRFPSGGPEDFPPNASYRATHLVRNQGARILYFISATAPQGTFAMGSCNLTTTFVMLNASCQQSFASTPRTCAATAMRRTLLDPAQGDLSVLDFQGVGRDLLVLQNFINSEGRAVSPPMGYLADPTKPYKFFEPFPDWTNVTAYDFSVRLTQMLNTYWVSAIAYTAIQGTFSIPEPAIPVGRAVGVHVRMLNTTGIVLARETIFQCSIAWSAVLLAASLAILIAALATLVLEAMRRGPDVLNNFSTLLKDNAYVHIPDGNVSSMCDGFELAQAWRSTKVQMGDVTVGNVEEGYVTIGTPDTVRMVQLGIKKKYL